MFVVGLSQGRVLIYGGIRCACKSSHMQPSCLTSLAARGFARSASSGEILTPGFRHTLSSRYNWSISQSIQSRLGNSLVSTRQLQCYTSQYNPITRHDTISLQTFTRHRSKFISEVANSAAAERIAPSELCDPYDLVKPELSDLADIIKKELACSNLEISGCSQYHFDGAGKYFRPMVVMLMARACNVHGQCNVDTNASASIDLEASQKHIALISEMIHTASLVHDDVIDTADIRRGRQTLQRSAGQRKAILAGDYILSVATRLLARIGDEGVVTVLSQVLEDLVSGEFMQLGSKEDEAERFTHYLRKTYKKTASLIANSCKSVAMLAKCPDDVVSVAFEYGRNVGIAFQLVDDLLDYISSEAVLGKPAAADLQLGLATAPILFAAELYPDELNPMIMRRFSQPGDVQRALELVSKSEGVSQTRYLALQHVKEAVRQIETLNDTRERQALINITQQVINRVK